VLRQAGIEPIVIVSGVDEDAVLSSLPAGTGPGSTTTALATAKAAAVARRLEPDLAADAVVIGCDSMLFLDGKLRGKPGTAARARIAWQEMAGRSADLYTGHSVARVRAGSITESCSEFSCTTVRFGTPRPDEIDAYIAGGEPLGVAGGFTLDGQGGWFIDGVDGDPSSVIGIGLPLTRALLQRTGISIAQLWATNNYSPRPTE